MGFWNSEDCGEDQRSTSTARVSQLIGHASFGDVKGSSRPQSLNALALCFLFLALATGVSVAATP